MIQACVYFKRRWRMDSKYIRTIVIAVIFLETLHLIFSAHGVWTYTIIYHADPAALAVVVWSTIETSGRGPNDVVFGRGRTDKLIRTMLANSLNTGLIVCLGSITILILLLILPESLYYVAVYMAVTKVYGISLLAILTWRGPQDNRHSRGPDPCASVSGTELDTAHAGVFTHTNIILSSASLENTEPRSSGTVYYE
ncbi:hypothetical protein HWV62_14368 [Athelia sp. TMB]|nr:hypothetical protein HWV62_14368 [Athelia sp. TMB]